MTRVFFRRFRMPEAAALREIEEARSELAAATTDEARLAAHLRAGFHLIPLEREAEAIVDLEAALAISRASGDRTHEIEALLHLATARQYRGEREAALSLFNEGLAMAAQTGVDEQEHFLLHHRGRCEVEMERPDEARRSFERALKLREKLGDARMIESSRAALQEIGGLWMYRSNAFAMDDLVALHEALRTRAFATVACVNSGAIEIAYAPVVLDANEGPKGGVRFHLAGNNPVASIVDGTPVVLSFLGPDAYVSPDWYETKGRVPTWNYIAIEGRGVVRRLDRDALHQLLIDLSADEENKLLPKKPWTIDKVPAEKMGGLMNAIVGFAVQFEGLEGKFKLSQNVTVEDAEGVMRGLIHRGGADGRDIARAMRRTRA